MSDYYDVGQFKKGASDKQRFVKLGSAKKRDKDDGFNFWLDALPTPDENGRIQVSILPQRDRQATAPAPRDEFNDSIPF